MKQVGRLGLLVLCSLVLTTACHPAATLPAETATPPPPISTPTSEPGFGPSWQLVLRVAAPAQMHFVGFLDDTFGIAVGQQGDLSYTVDGGLSTGSQPMAALRFHDADRGVVILQDTHHLWSAHTTDGGQTWQREGIPGVPTRCTLYLARNGETLTMFDGAEIIILRYRGTAQ